MKVHLACIFALLAGCQSPAKADAERVAFAMDRFRKAPNAGKPELVSALRGVSCSDADVCQAKDACLKSADATSKSLVLKEEVQAALERIDAGTLAKDSDEARGLSAKLDESATLLDEGFKALPACDEQVLALKRKYQF